MELNIDISKPFQKWTKINKLVKIAFGGRGGTKTYSCILILLVFSFFQKYKNMLFIIARQTYVSIEKSSYALLKRLIIEKNLQPYFTMTKSYIENNITKVRFYFVSIAERQMSSIKSTDNIKFFLIEEAEDLTIGSWLDLLPTVRGIDAEGSLSEVWLIFNPKRYYDFSYSLVKPYLSRLKTITFKHKDKTYKYHEFEDTDTYILNVNYYSNSFENASLEKTRVSLQRDNPEMYRHVWLGEVLYSGGRVFSSQQLKYYNYNDFMENQAKYYTYRAIVDPAFGNENCFTSCVIYCQVGNDFYIIDSGLMRTDANNTTDEAITRFLKSYNVREVMCEANFHQQELVKRLKRHFEVQPFYQKVNKIERIVDNSIKIREHVYFDEQSLNTPDNSDVNQWLKTREGRNYIGMMQLFNFSDIPSENCNKNDDFSYIDFVDVITSLVMFAKKRYEGKAERVSFGEKVSNESGQYRQEIDNRIKSISRKSKRRLDFGFNN